MVVGEVLDDNARLFAATSRMERTSGVTKGDVRLTEKRCDLPQDIILKLMSFIER
jgi:hypothetical protein